MLTLLELHCSSSFTNPDAQLQVVLVKVFIELLHIAEHPQHWWAVPWCICVLCIRAVMTFENASCIDPPARAPLAPRCTADTITHLHCQRHRSTSTDQVRERVISFTSAFTSFRLHIGATTYGNSVPVCVCVCLTVYVALLLAIYHFEVFLLFLFPSPFPASLICHFLPPFSPSLFPHPFFSPSTSLSEHLAGMLKLCSSLRSSNSDNRPTSPFRHHFLPHNKGKNP